MGHWVILRSEFKFLTPEYDGTFRDRDASLATVTRIALTNPKLQNQERELTNTVGTITVFH